MKQFANPLRFLILAALTFVLLWELYFSIGYIYFYIIHQKWVAAAITAIGLVVVLMIFGTLVFNSLPLLIRKINPYKRLRLFIFIPFILVFMAVAIPSTSKYWKYYYRYMYNNANIAVVRLGVSLAGFHQGSLYNAICSFLNTAGVIPGDFWNSSALIISGGRLDSVEYLGNGVVLTGSRDPNPSHVYKSSDYGATWADKGVVTQYGITTIKSAGSGTAYLTTGNGHVWKTADYGESWSDLGKISNNEKLTVFDLVYGLLVTSTGTVLLADTSGHIFRSTDRGLSWSDLGIINSGGFYRFDKVGNGIIVNSFNGYTYKSIDDGATWINQGRLTGTPLYATEYLESGIALQASEDGHIFRSTDNGNTWSDLGKISSEGADDFVYAGNGLVIYSTYTGWKSVWRSLDYGQTWTNVGGIDLTTGVPDDSLEHQIYFNDNGIKYIIGVTNQEYVVRKKIIR